jgi:hypothetical protein
VAGDDEATAEIMQTSHVDPLPWHNYLPGSQSCFDLIGGNVSGPFNMSSPYRNLFGIGLVAIGMLAGLHCKAAEAPPGAQGDKPLLLRVFHVPPVFADNPDSPILDAKEASTCYLYDGCPLVIKSGTISGYPKKKPFKTPESFAIVIRANIVNSIGLAYREMALKKAGSKPAVGH